MKGPLSVPANEAVEGFFIPDMCATRQVFLLVVLTELMVMVYTLASSSLPRFNWELLAVSSLLVQWMVLLSAAFLCVARNVLSRQAVPIAVVLSLGTIALVTALTSLTVSYLTPNIGGDGWWVLRNVMVALVVGGIVLRYFYLQQQLRETERAELLARFESLRARIRPHFLFNTLNSIASLIAIRPDDAETAVENLSELFRHSLAEDERPTTVADELHLCRLYLDIERLRLGDRLQVDWAVKPATEKARMPALLLQPLVENAVYHGIAQLAAGGTIRIEIGEDDGQLRVEMENPLPETESHKAGHRMALTNIEQRLTAMYGTLGVINARREDEVFRVSLSYPLVGSTAIERTA